MIYLNESAGVSGVFLKLSVITDRKVDFFILKVITDKIPK